jgi:cell division protein FtsB
MDTISSDLISVTDTKVLIWLVITLLAILAYVGKLGVSQLQSIAKSVNRMEKDLGVLTNDHTNLKEDVKEVKERVTKLEDHYNYNNHSNLN